MTICLSGNVLLIRSFFTVIGVSYVPAHMHPDDLIVEKH